MATNGYLVVTVLHVVSAYAEWDAFSDELSGELAKRQLVPLPRVGRAFWQMKRQGIIPSPRVGRSDPSLTWQLAIAEAINNQNAKHFQPMHVLPTSSRPSNDRQKRSPQDQSEGTSASSASDELEMNKTFRDWLSNSNSGMTFNRNTRQLIPAPRVGRRSSGDYPNKGFDPVALLGSYFAAANSGEEDGSEGSDPIDLQLRAVYIPRFGKRAPYGSAPFLKRAAFTPRIGRAVAFTPRLGRSSWDDEAEDILEGRPARAAFTPRIGRSVRSEKEMKQQAEQAVTQ